VNLSRPVNVSRKVWARIRGCWGKRTFPTRRATKPYAKAFRQTPYFCPYANHWHLTSKRPRKSAPAK